MIFSIKRFNGRIYNGRKSKKYYYKEIEASADSLADCDGGCNPDVLVIRVKDPKQFSPKYVYYALRRKSFLDHMMQDKSGVKMPRGNKTNNLRFGIPNIGWSEQYEILNHVEKMEAEIQNALSLMNSCEARKRDIENEYIFER